MQLLDKAVKITQIYDEKFQHYFSFMKPMDL